LPTDRAGRRTRPFSYTGFETHVKHLCIMKNINIGSLLVGKLSVEINRAKYRQERVRFFESIPGNNQFSSYMVSYTCHHGFV